MYVFQTRTKHFRGGTSDFSPVDFPEMSVGNTFVDVHFIMFHFWLTVLTTTFQYFSTCIFSFFVLLSTCERRRNEYSHSDYPAYWRRFRTSNSVLRLRCSIRDDDWQFMASCPVHSLMIATDDLTVLYYYHLHRPTKVALVPCPRAVVFVHDVNQRYIYTFPRC